MTFEALLDTYYDGLAKRSGWEQTIAEGFEFTAASPANDSRGRAAFIEMLRRFSRTFETVSVKKTLIDGDTACVIATYGLVSPSGQKTTKDVAEIWTAREGQLASLAIYFDTAGWRSFMAA